MSKTAKIIVSIIVIAVVAIVGYTAYRNQKPTLSGPVKVGVIITLTGNYQDVGRRIKEGINLAFSDLQKGRSNQKFEIIYEDGKLDPKTAIVAYRKLVDIDGVKIVIAAHSNVSLALAPIAQQEKILLFTLYANAPGIPETGDYVFRNDINAASEMEKISEFIFSKGYKNLGLFYVKSAGAISEVVEFKKDFVNLGGKISNDESYEQNEADYRTYLLKIKASNPEAIFSLNAPKQMGLILNQARTLEMSQPFFSCWQAEGEELISVAGKNADGLIYSQTFDQNSQDDVVKSFVEEYKKAYSQEADYRSALGYDTFMLIANAANACSMAEPNCLKDRLLEIKNLKMVTGITTIDQNGDTAKDIIIKTVKNGQFVKYGK